MVRGKETGKEKIHILFVDDDRDMLNAVETMLVPERYRVTIAADGRAGVILFSSCPHAFDLVITDFNMPFMDGQQLIQEVTAIRTDLPIILSTGCLEMKEEAFQTWGVNALLSKPYTQEELENLIQQVLDHGGNSESLDDR